MLALPAACTNYESKPLDPVSELASLKSMTLDDLVFAPEVADAASAPVARFDPSDGLDETELVSIALTLNPELKAKRFEIGEAEALLVGAGLLPNPRLNASIEHGFGAPASAVGGGLSVLFELLRPGERTARRAVADARVDAVRRVVAADEYRVAAEVRKAHIALVAAERSVLLAEQEAALRDQVGSLVERRKDLGEATALDVALIDLERTGVQRALRNARAERDARLRTLLAVIGLPLNLEVSDLKLSDSGNTLSRIEPDLTDDEIDALLLTQRLDLRAAEADYHTAESELALAVKRQSPRVGVGPSLHKDAEGIAPGAEASLEIPFFDRNQGEIAEKTAAREHARAEYVAMLQERRAQAFEARALLRRANAEVEFEEREILPQLARTEALFEGAFKTRDLTIFGWLTARDEVLKARSGHLDAIVSRARALAEFESAIGQPIAGAAGSINPSRDSERRQP